MGSNCCKGDAARPVRSSSIYSRSRAGAALDDRFTSSEEAGGVRLTVSAATTGDSGVYTLQANNAAGSDTSRVHLEVSAEETPTGEDPPTFLRRLQDLTVKVGTRTRFLVEIVSSTECKVTWYRNERRLLEAERVSLVRDGSLWCADVAAVSVDDAGRWTCSAENDGGRASCSAHLNVLVPKAYKRPEFVEELRALLTEQGTVSLECKVIGVPTPVLRWFKDSREIKAGDVFALTANAEDPTSLGTYTCEAVNCMGRAYSSSKVHVVGRGSRETSQKPKSGDVALEPPPIFTKELEDHSMKICEPLTLGCHLVVPPWPRSVVWYNKEGKVEPGDRYHVLEDGVGGYLLEVPSAEWADEGEWKCVASSSGGRVGISTCYVAMEVPKNYRKPRFMENLQAVLTEEGLVSFECKVVGFPTPVLSWFKDGQELKPGDVYQLTGTNSLGSYCCIARNCMGQASSSAELTVEDIQNQLNEEEKLQLFSKNQAPKFIQGLKSVEAKIDEPFRFTVKVAIPPEPSLLWYRDEQPVDESSRCHLGKEDRGGFYLDIQTLEFLDQAEWKCVAVNDFGHSVTSCFLKLIIPRHYKKPRFLENLQAILSEEGAVNLECKVIGVPQPVLKWYKDGEELKPGDIHRIISGQDGTCCLGTYTCEAQNCMGIAASSASLLGFDDSMKSKQKKAEEQALQRNLSLSTIHEERTSQMYDTPVGDITLDDKGEISFSFDGKEVSVSLYETPDLTEEEALQIVEMYADQLSENVTEHNVVELPPLRFVKETSTSGNLLMEAIIIDVSPDYFISPEEDLRTEADVEDISIADENGPPLLSLEQDAEIGGEDYLEKTMALLSDEKSDIPAKLGRKKSDSQKSVDDFYSLSRDQSLSEEKRDDDTHLSESDLVSYESARSSAKAKSKSSKPSVVDEQESFEPTKTILSKGKSADETEDEVLKTFEITNEQQQALTVPETKQKPKRERRSSRGSRKSSTGSERSTSKSKEELCLIKSDVELFEKKPSMSDEEFIAKMSNISEFLTKVTNDVQLIERDIILKSELMSSAATASRSLEIINSLITPLSEIHSIAEAAKDSVSESRDLTSTIFNSLPQSLKTLHQSLTIVEKCIDMESDNKTLVKKTCVAFIETCGSDVQKVISEVTAVTAKDYLQSNTKIVNEIDSLAREMSSVIKFSADTIKARNLLTEFSEIKHDEPSSDEKHLKETQKAVFELKRPVNSLLSIVQNAESGKMIELSKIKNSDVLLHDMSTTIQDLQQALEQIESLSISESISSVPKYNTETIEAVVEPILRLRSAFEKLSQETTTGEHKVVLKEVLTSIKENLTDVSSQLNSTESKIGKFNILQSDNKLNVLQKMAQSLILLENNLSRLELMPEVQTHMNAFHKNLTKVLELVIEDNEAEKYFILMEICDAVNRINTSLKIVDTEDAMPLASLSNTLTIIQDRFVKNDFESELNCFIISNITDILVGIEKSINKAEELSQKIDSEHIQDFATILPSEANVNVVMEQIEQTIASINTVKTIECTQDLKSRLLPTLENICPILEDLKNNVASIRQSEAEQNENISDLSIASIAATLATPLSELQQNILVFNQLVLENLESLKANSEIIPAIAEPLHELHTMLEILQQDIISQYNDDITPFEGNGNIAGVVQSLRSCIVMIEEQDGVERIEEFSTLEDISNIKTSADTLPSDHLILPTAEETGIEQSIPHFSAKLPVSATAQVLQSLNEHLIVLQTPEVIDALDTLSDISDFSSLKSVGFSVEYLHNGIERILHPVALEATDSMTHLPDLNSLATIAQPLRELQQSLSVLDTTNIPIYEDILDLPEERVHSIIESISALNKQLSIYDQAIHPAINILSNTFEVSTELSSLRNTCCNLKNAVDSAKVTYGVISSEIKKLEEVVEQLLIETDVSKGIKVNQIKSITEILFEKLIRVQEEIIQFTSQPCSKLAQEIELIEIAGEVENHIAVLQQYDFLDLSRVSEISSCISPQFALEIESESLALMGDIVQNAVNVVQDYSQQTPITDQIIVEEFFKTCKNGFTILRCLITKTLSHKKIIRLLEEFQFLQNTINEFKIKRLNLKLSDDINGCLTTFLGHTDDCFESLLNSLEKIIDSHSEMLISKPTVKLQAIKTIRQNYNAHNDLVISNIIEKLVDIIETSEPLTRNLQNEIIQELRQPTKAVVKHEENILGRKFEDFTDFIQKNAAVVTDIELKKTLKNLSSCIIKHQDFKDASSIGKNLISIKCLSECVDILKEKNTIVDEKVVSFADKEKEHTLKEVLTEMLQPLQALQNQLLSIRDQVILGVEEDTNSFDITSTESLVQTMTELHKDIVQQIESEKSTVDNEDICLIMEVDKEIHTIKDSIKSMENIEAAQVVKELTKPMEDIEKSLHDVLTSEKDLQLSQTMSKEKSADLLQHIDQYIELIEIVEEISAIIKIEDVKETFEIARELKNSINISAKGEISTEVMAEIYDEQAKLATKLQKALSALQVQVLDSAQELAPSLSNDVLQRIAQVTAQLQADLVAVTGVHIAVQAPLPITETVDSAKLISIEKSTAETVENVSDETNTAETIETSVFEHNVEEVLTKTNQTTIATDLTNLSIHTDRPETIEDVVPLQNEDRNNELSIFKDSATQLPESVIMEGVEKVKKIEKFTEDIKMPDSNLTFEESMKQAPMQAIVEEVQTIKKIETFAEVHELAKQFESTDSDITLKDSTEKLSETVVVEKASIIEKVEPVAGSDKKAKQSELTDSDLTQKQLPLQVSEQIIEEKYDEILEPINETVKLTKQIQSIDSDLTLNKSTTNVSEPFIVEATEIIKKSESKTIEIAKETATDSDLITQLSITHVTEPVSTIGAEIIEKEESKNKTVELIKKDELLNSDLTLKDSTMLASEPSIVKDTEIVETCKPMTKTVDPTKQAELINLDLKLEQSTIHVSEPVIIKEAEIIEKLELIAEAAETTKQDMLLHFDNALENSMIAAQSAIVKAAEIVEKLDTTIEKDELTKQAVLINSDLTLEPATTQIIDSVIVKESKLIEKTESMCEAGERSTEQDELLKSGKTIKESMTQNIEPLSAEETDVVEKIVNMNETIELTTQAELMKCDMTFEESITKISEPSIVEGHQTVEKVEQVIEMQKLTMEPKLTDSDKNLKELTKQVSEPLIVKDEMVIKPESLIETVEINKEDESVNCGLTLEESTTQASVPVIVEVGTLAEPMTEVHELENQSKLIDSSTKREDYVTEETMILDNSTKEEIKPSLTNIDEILPIKQEMLSSFEATKENIVEEMEKFVSSQEVNKLSDVANFETLKTAITIAQDLLKNIAAVETCFDSGPYDVSTLQFSAKQAILAQDFKNAISVLHNQSLESLQEMAPDIEKTDLQRITKTVNNLCFGLNVDLTVIETSQQSPNLITLTNVQDEAAVDKSLLESTEVLLSDITTQPTEIIDLELQQSQSICEESVLSDVYPVKVTEPIEVTTSVTEPLFEKPAKLSTEQQLLQHLDEFVANDILETVHDISNITNIDADALKESVSIAKELQKCILAVDNTSLAEETSIMNTLSCTPEEVQLTAKLQNALSILHTQVLDSAELITTLIKPESLQKISEVITQLQDDLATATETNFYPVIQSIDLETIEKVHEHDTMHHLVSLLQDVNSQINNSISVKNTEDIETLKDTLDEVQTVIIKLKRDYDGAVNDTLNETLDDLECSVRSVQLQINEDSPPELLKEACETLQLLAENIKTTEELKVSDHVSTSVPVNSILEKCSGETDNTLQLLETAIKFDPKNNSNLNNIISNLNNLTDRLKSLKNSFLSDANTLIENGVDVIQCLSILEDNVFALEKDVEIEQTLSPYVRDSIITAVHAVYGSISNMRGTISSIQKRYMFENYGQPSELLLQSIKNIATIVAEIDDKGDWKKLSKSIRKVLNHFEDVKFYINLDKTARIPSDSAFTKIILESLRTNISNVLMPQGMRLGNKIEEVVGHTLSSINVHLMKINDQTSLDVKTKIPIFKNLATEVYNTTSKIKMTLEEMKKHAEGPLPNTKESSDSEIPEECFVDLKSDQVPDETYVSQSENFMQPQITSDFAENSTEPGIMIKTNIDKSSTISIDDSNIPTTSKGISTTFTKDMLKEDKVTELECTDDKYKKPRQKKSTDEEEKEKSGKDNKITNSSQEEKNDNTTNTEKDNKENKIAGLVKDENEGLETGPKEIKSETDDVIQHEVNEGTVAAIKHREEEEKYKIWLSNEKNIAEEKKEQNSLNVTQQLSGKDENEAGHEQRNEKEKTDKAADEAHSSHNEENQLQAEKQNKLTALKQEEEEDDTTQKTANDPKVNQKLESEKNDKPQIQNEEDEIVKKATEESQRNLETGRKEKEEANKLNKAKEQKKESVSKQNEDQKDPKIVEKAQQAQQKIDDERNEIEQSKNEEHETSQKDLLERENDDLKQKEDEKFKKSAEGLQNKSDVFKEISEIKPNEEEGKSQRAGEETQQKLHTKNKEEKVKKAQNEAQLQPEKQRDTELKLKEEEEKAQRGAKETQEKLETENIHAEQRENEQKVEKARKSEEEAQLQAEKQKKDTELKLKEKEENAKKAVEEAQQELDKDKNESKQSQKKKDKKVQQEKQEKDSALILKEKEENCENPSEEVQQKQDKEDNQAEQRQNVQDEKVKKAEEELQQGAEQHKDTELKLKDDEEKTQRAAKEAQEELDTERKETEQRKKGEDEKAKNTKETLQLGAEKHKDTELKLKDDKEKTQRAAKEAQEELDTERKEIEQRKKGEDEKVKKTEETLQLGAEKHKDTELKLKDDEEKTQRAAKETQEELNNERKKAEQRKKEEADEKIRKTKEEVQLLVEKQQKDTELKLQEEEENANKAVQKDQKQLETETKEEKQIQNKEDKTVQKSKKQKKDSALKLKEEEEKRQNASVEAQQKLDDVKKQAERRQEVVENVRKAEEEDQQEGEKQKKNTELKLKEEEEKTQKAAKEAEDKLDTENKKAEQREKDKEVEKVRKVEEEAQLLVKKQKNDSELKLKQKEEAQGAPKEAQEKLETEKKKDEQKRRDEEEKVPKTKKQEKDSELILKEEEEKRQKCSEKDQQELDNTKKQAEQDEKQQEVKKAEEAQLEAEEQMKDTELTLKEEEEKAHTATKEAQEKLNTDKKEGEQRKEEEKDGKVRKTKEETLLRDEKQKKDTESKQKEEVEKAKKAVEKDQQQLDTENKENEQSQKKEDKKDQQFKKQKKDSLLKLKEEKENCQNPAEEVQQKQDNEDNEKRQNVQEDEKVKKAEEEAQLDAEKQKKDTELKLKERDEKAQRTAKEAQEKLETEMKQAEQIQNEQEVEKMRKSEEKTQLQPEKQKIDTELKFKEEEEKARRAAKEAQAILETEKKELEQRQREEYARITKEEAQLQAEKQKKDTELKPKEEDEKAKRAVEDAQQQLKIERKDDEQSQKKREEKIQKSKKQKKDTALTHLKEDEEKLPKFSKKAQQKLEYDKKQAELRQKEQDVESIRKTEEEAQLQVEKQKKDSEIELKDEEETTQRAAKEAQEQLEKEKKQFERRQKEQEVEKVSKAEEEAQLLVEKQKIDSELQLNEENEKAQRAAKKVQDKLETEKKEAELRQREEETVIKDAEKTQQKQTTEKKEEEKIRKTDNVAQLQAEKEKKDSALQLKKEEEKAIEETITENENYETGIDLKTSGNTKKTSEERKQKGIKKKKETEIKHKKEADKVLAGAENYQQKAENELKETNIKYIEDEKKNVEKEMREFELDQEIERKVKTSELNQKEKDTIITEQNAEKDKKKSNKTKEIEEKAVQITANVQDKCTKESDRNNELKTLSQREMKTDHKHEKTIDDKIKMELPIYEKSVQKENDNVSNGNATRNYAKASDQHYIKEYQYEPSPTITNQGFREKPKFIDHNRRDYTMEFARPPAYTEKSFDSNIPIESHTLHDLGRNAAIYKAQTIVLDSQLRSISSPYLDTCRSSESSRKPELRQRSKALSEARNLISDKKSGVSRDSKRKPVFSTHLTDRTAVEGSRVKLTCSVLSSTDPIISWYKNGILLDNKLKYRTKYIDGLITLEVLNAIPSDSAEYSCSVENENGSISSSANLKVYPSFEASPIPPTFTRSIRDAYHLAENELVLECRIRGQPLPTITWLKDDRPIASNDRYQAYYLADGVCRLAIESPTPEDSGKYTCRAENSVWSDQITHVVTFTGRESRLSPNIATLEKSRFNRQVMESRRPHFTNVLTDYKVTKGGTIGLQVEIRGAPTSVEWLREGRSVTELYRNAKTFVEQSLYTLALTDVTEKESGMYTCRAWSAHGNVDMNAAITVVQPNELEGKAAIIVGRPEKHILISVGEDVVISFRVQGDPKPKVFFMKGIRDFTSNQRACKMTSDDYVKFTLKRSVISDAGTYCILARNAYGCDRAFVTVEVRQRASSDQLISDWTYPADEASMSVAERNYKSVPERIPGEPTVVDGGSNWVSLSWPKPEPGVSAPVLAYKVESWLLGKEGGARWVELGITPLNSFDAFNLKQGEEYHFRVTPRNRYGWGESVQTVQSAAIGVAGDRPEFVDILPGQLKVLTGETAKLNCSVKGKPTPEVVWMKNGHEIEEDGDRISVAFNGYECKLVIKDIGIEDEARYSCEATNVHGRSSTYARLAVVTDRMVWEADAKLKRERSADASGEYPPQFTMRLRDRRVQATYPVRLTCQVIGSPSPTVSWYKDCELVETDKRHCQSQDEHFHTLEIAPTALEDGGMYEALARNSSGAVSCRCSLVVDKGIRAYVAPEFCCGLEPLYRLSDGEELRISAVVEAYPSVGVTWYRDGVRLRPSRRAIMTLDRDGQIELALAAVTSRDAGVYTCTASNEVGRASTSGKVEVIGGEEHTRKPPPVLLSPDVPYSKEPMFIRKPRSSSAREGDTVIIQCEVVGDPKPDVYWLRDFLKPDYYRDATHFRRVGLGPEYRFEIPHAKLDYTGAYSVVARNVHGEAKAVISLQILAKDPTSPDEVHNIRYGEVEVLPRFEKELTDLLSCDGDAVEFECRISGHPTPDIRWFHYHELIRESEDFEWMFEDGSARLKIRQVTAEDEGTYTCEASNNLGKAVSSACLVVYPAGEPNTLCQRLRRPAALGSCVSTPRSTPRTTPARSMSRARTPGPDQRRLCSPARQMAPTFYTYPFNKVAEEGDTVTLQCAVKGLPAPWATWDKDGVIITPSSRITLKEKDEILRILEIEQVTIEDVGVYRITVENEFGRAEASARLEVITQRGKFYAGVRAYSPSPRRSLTYRSRRPSTPRQD